MEDLLNELVDELDSLEKLISTKVPRDSDYALQWTLNRVVKKKADSIAAVIETSIKKLLAVLGAQKVENESAATIQMLQHLQRKYEYSLKLSQHSGIGVNFAQKRRKTLHEVLAEMNGLTVASNNPIESTKEKKIKRTGANFSWLFQPPVNQGFHALSSPAAIVYPKRLERLAEKYVCKRLKYKECVDYVRFCKEWHKEPIGPIRSPYAEEIDAMEQVYAKHEDPWGYEIKEGIQNTLFKISEPAPYKKVVRVTGTPSSQTEAAEPAVLVDTPEALKQFIDKVLSYSSSCPDQMPVIAIDVEFSHRGSYRGSVALIQLSTEKNDYLIDPLKISVDVMHQLNQLTANPGILKVMHGIQHDILWLQNDFGIYFVNIFDTYQAAKALRLPGGNSLYNLVLSYCQILLDKSVQLSDWRVRPLTTDQVNYAREDTHYLIHIFGAMRNQLLSMTIDPPPTSGAQAKSKEASITTKLGSRKMLGVLHETNLVAANVMSWFPPNLDAKLDKLHTGTLGTLNPQTNALRLCAEVIFAWRDLRARDLNEPPHSVVTDVLLYKALAKCIKFPHQLKDALPGVNDDIVKTMQYLISQTLEKLENPDDVYVGMALSRKKLKSVTLQEQPSSPAGGDSCPESVSESVRPVKKRRVVPTEIDRVKSEQADDGRLSELPCEMESGGECDLDVSLKGYYQVGAGSIALFEKEGNRTFKTIKVIKDKPLWLCVLNGPELCA